MTTTTPARAVNPETISQYTEDIEQAGTTYAAGVLSLLFATIDTYLIGDSHDACPLIGHDAAGREQTMVDAVAQAYQLIASLPCMCREDYQCPRCVAIGDNDEHRSVHAMTAAEVIHQSLLGAGPVTDPAAVRLLSGRIALDLWAAGRLHLPDEDAIEPMVRAIAGTKTPIPDHSDVAAWDEIRRAAAAAAAVTAPLRDTLTAVTQRYGPVAATTLNDCQACTAVDGECPYHQGVRAGILYATDVINGLNEELDLARGVTHQTPPAPPAPAAADR